MSWWMHCWKRTKSLHFFISLGPFVTVKKMKNVITWGSWEVITIPLGANLKKKEAWCSSLFQSFTDEVIWGLQGKSRRLDSASNRYPGLRTEVEENNAINKADFKMSPYLSLNHICLDCDYPNNQYCLIRILSSLTQHKHQDKIRLSESSQQFGAFCGLPLGAWHYLINTF